MQMRDSLLSLSLCRKLLTTRHDKTKTHDNQSNSGFTIVELLVVIVVIGILAAITIVSFTGIKQKAIAGSLQSDLDNASKQLKMYQVTDDNGNYPGANECPTPSAANICLKASGTNTLTYTPNNSTTPKSFTLDALNGSIGWRITNDSTPVAVAADPYASDPNWIAGTTATAMAGKYVRSTDLGSTYMYKTANTAVEPPQGEIGLDPNYPASMVLTSPQTYPAVDFSEYPAQNACKAIGGRLPNTYELMAIHAGRITTYGNNFHMYDFYWSSTEYDSNSGFAYFLEFYSGNTSLYQRMNSLYVRCVAG